MKLQTLFRACDKIISTLESKSPGKTITTSEGKIPFTELSTELRNLCSWCYSESIDVKKIVRCKDCKHYKVAKIRDEKYPSRHKSIHMCTLTKQQYKPEYFCANGEEK